MKRRLFDIAAALSLLLAIASAAAWATSHSGSPAWRLLGAAHSADLTRAPSADGTLLFTTTPNWAKSPNYGFWDAWWILNRSGRVSVLAQTIDYEGTLGRVSSAPPSVVVELPGPAARRVVVFRDISGPVALGVGVRSDARTVDAVDARGRIVTLPLWFFVLLGLPLPILWLRRRRRRHASEASTAVPLGRA